ncbi:MAG: hypothetical protein KAH25_08520, partial [Bacteroidales bacterium]|nr:hypothetical protein [Bacteroidales bacterium]
DIRVMHYDPKTKKSEPYPNLAWNTPRAEDDHYFDSILGIRSDDRGIIWILDMGLREGLTPKLVGWNSKTNRLEKIYYIPQPASLKTSQLNDFVIDYKHGVFIIADEEIGRGGDGSKAALVIVNMKTGEVKRLLEGHRSTAPEDVKVMIDGKPLNIPGTQKAIKVGADGITADKNNEWLYYAPMSGSKVYRVKIDDLIDANLTEDQLDKKIQTYADKENNGGLSIDVDDNLYLTYIESKSVGVIPAIGKKSEHYISDEKLNWPDGVSYNKDGYMYVSAAQLPNASVFNDGVDKTTKPFYIFRFKPIKEGVFGR